MYQSLFFTIQTLSLLRNFLNVLFQKIELTESLNIHYCTHIIRFKAFVHCFLFLQQMVAIENYKKCFILKFIFILEIYIQVFVYFFCFLSTISKFKRTNESGIFMPSIELHKVAHIFFGITQKTLYII